MRARSVLSMTVGAVVLAAASLSIAQAQGLPTEIGQCVTTKIKSAGDRFADDPASGSAIAYENGGSQVSHEVLPAVAESRIGDQVRLCLVSRPRNCPANDQRGSVWRARNLRTQQGWELPDSAQKCGGA